MHERPLCKKYTKDRGAFPLASKCCDWDLPQMRKKTKIISQKNQVKVLTLVA